MISLSRTGLFALCAAVTWVGACVFATDGLTGSSTTSSSSSTTTDMGGHGGTLFTGGTGGMGTGGMGTGGIGTGGMGTGGATTSSTGTGGGCPTGMKLCGAMCAKVDVMHGCNGSSCMACDMTNVMTAACDMTTGACAVTMCKGGFGDCDGDASNGCESTFATDVNNCGGCGAVCTNANGTTKCMGGKCVPTCAPGYDDCDGNKTNGCEMPVGADVFNCGKCGRVCSSNHVASLSCTGGLCDSTCVLGFGNCAMPPPGGDDGCEKAVDDANCGGCGNACGAGLAHAQSCGAAGDVCGCTNNNQCQLTGSGAGGTCSNSRCVCNGTTCRPGEACDHPNTTDVCSCHGMATCANGESCCKDGCHDFTQDAANCGACGHACAPGLVCGGGTCSCSGMDAVCNAGAPAGTFTCPTITGPDVCHCGGTTCLNGQRCLSDGTCG